MSITANDEAPQPDNGVHIPFYIEVASENSLIVYFGSDNPDVKPVVTPALCSAINRAQTLLNSRLGERIVDTIVSYASLLVTFDVWQVDHFHVRVEIESLLSGLTTGQAAPTRTITLPVFYDIKVGPDLPRIATHSGLSIDEVILRHQQQEYYVYTIGFAPGFAYLGEVNESIAMPRLATPRSAVAKGSVAIADKQTAVYPATSPGGWNIIGRCPTPMFNPDNDPPSPVSVGDKVRFKAITEKQFIALGGQL
ncbi:5-oxoprolinase subunit B family protein [Thalassotalea litorea]|uniref:5-oxoprolinase subunit B family protein n=1 Tax=Thalassotalea litorea TaxID=2020715 RepID=UPI003735EEBD